MPNLPRYSLLTIAVFAAMVIAAAQNPPVPATKSTTTFTEMKSLVGEFTMDGDHLIATHYCIAGNQPQMVTGVPDDLQKGVTFTLARVTGMKTPDDWHNTGLTVTLDDKDHMTQRWTYLYKGAAGTTTFHYTRKK